MPVYERGYKHWEPSGRKASPPWWVIARRGISAPLKRRVFMLLLMIAWVPAIVKGGILYFTFKAGQLFDAGSLVRLVGGGWASIEAPGFFTFLTWQKYFVLIFTTIVGARLIAKDRQENGLALYFARPVTLIDYVLGKSLIIMFYYFTVTLFPLYALAIFGYLVTAGATGLEMLVEIPLRATVFCTLTGLSLSLVLLALSSMGRRAVFITVGWVLIYLGTEQIANIVTLFGNKWLRIVDFPGQYFQAGAYIFQASPPHELSPWLSFLMVAGYTLGACLILRDRIRPVEVVS